MGKKISIFWRRGLWSLLSLMLMCFIGVVIACIILSSQLPSVDVLKDVKLQVPLRIYSSDGQLITEFGEVRRIPVTIDEVPQPLIQALLSTEDQRFYRHPGVDIFGLARAAVELFRTGEKVQGGSTITMQVARNFFLSRKKTYLRKFNEILLAIKIDSELSKDDILELYLNKIYLGNRAYGVGAAAQVYYGKSLEELSLAQLAMIAGLPKAPSAINPIANPEAAKKRRNHVLERMLIEGYIEPSAYQEAINAPITAKYHGPQSTLSAPYVAEMIRLALYEHFGEDTYNKGYQVYTTIDAAKQTAANAALQKGLTAYDRRHGYRGAIDNFGQPMQEYYEQWQEKLKAIPSINHMQPAVVINLNQQSVDALLANGSMITIPWSGLAWASPQLPSGYVGQAPKQATDILRPGDVIRVEQLGDESWRLTQVPDVEGALVALDPNSGAIRSLVGGYAYQKSHYNRATQAERQPGSSFKPFIYASALDHGFTMATVINDAPIVLDDPTQENLWRPQNATRQFYGPTRLRSGLVHSRNLVSIRILDNVGINHTIDYLTRFGFNRNGLPRSLSLALGSLSVTPLELTAAYAVFANGGYKVTPYVIDKITDVQGHVILESRPHITVNPKQPHANNATRVIDPQVAYLITTALQDVIQYGTGREAKRLQRHDIAGKTGSTNQFIDAWFAGFNPDLVATVWVGFDQPKTLREYGSRVALPIWTDFMAKALANTPEHYFLQPEGLISVRIDPKTGALASPNQPNAIFEIFREDHVPSAVVSDFDYQKIDSDGDGTMEHLF